MAREQQAQRDRQRVEAHVSRRQQRSSRKKESFKGWEMLRFAKGSGLAPRRSSQDELESAMLLAARAGDARAVESLLRKGAPVGSRGYKYNASALHAAAFTGSLDTMGVLLRWKADPNVTDSRGFTPLMKAAMAGHTEAVRMLLNAGAKPDTKCKEGKRAIHWAIRGGYQELCSMLMSQQQAGQ